MAYQAGQAFIQTVPSLRGFVRKVRADLKAQFGANPIDVPVKPDADWTPLKREATKEGADAGGAFAKTFRARVDAALKSIPDIKVGADTSEADLELAGLRTRLQALRDVRVGVDLDAGEAQAEVAAISAQLQRLSRDDARIDVQTNTAAASAELAKISGQAARLDGKDVEIDVHVDRDGRAVANAGAVGRSMRGLILVGGLLAPTFLPALGAITVAVGATASAFAGAAIGAGAFVAAVLPATTAVAEALKAQEAAAKDAATSTVANAQKQLQAAYAAKSAADAVAEAQRNADQTAVDGAKRVTDARRRVTDAQRAANRVELDGLDQIEAAQDDVARARERAVDIVEAARDRLVDAGRAVIAAQADERRAQEDLTEARKDAARTLEDLRGRVTDLALSEEGAEIALIEARQRQAAVNADVKSSELDKRKAALDVAEAEARLADVRRDQRDSVNELNEARRKGIKGSDQVKAAEQRIAEASTAVADAIRDQRAAQAERALADVEAAGVIGDAEEALARTREEVAARNVDALEQVTDAETAVAEAREAAAAANEDAARRTTAALAAQAQQAELARLESEQGSAATRNLAAAMGALTPMQKQLMDGWVGLREAFTDWANALEPATIPVLLAGMEHIQALLPLLTPIVEATAGAFGALLDAASAALEAPFWRNFFDFLARTAGPSTEAFGTIFGNLVTTFAGLLVAFEPMLTTFMGWLVDLTGRWADWATTLDQNDGFQRFLQFVSDNAPKLSAFFGALWQAFVNILAALAPLAGPMLTALTAVLNFVANLPPPVLAGIAAGFVAIGIALAAMNGVIAVLAANPIILVIAALAGLAVGFYVAYQRSEEFRAVVDRVLREIGKVVRWLYEEVWKPTWDALVELYETSLKPVLKELGRLFTEVIGPAIVWFGENIMGPFYKLMTWIFVKILAPMFGWFLRNVVRPALTGVIELFKSLGRIANWLWKNILKPTFKVIGDAFSALGRFFKGVWDDYLFPVFDLFGKILFGPKSIWALQIKPFFGLVKEGFRAVGDFFHNTWHKTLKPIIKAFGYIWGRDVQPLIDTFVGTFSSAWDKAKGAARDAINWVIRNVLNKGLVAGFNLVAKFFGAKKMGDIPEIGKKTAAEAGAAGKKNRYPTQGGKRIPEFASGGVIPGTRTIRDSVYIHARPDEAVMVPQFTDQVGGERGVHTLNRMAERGQLRAMLGEHAEGFASGGVVSYKGHAFTEAMVARIKNAEKLAGTAFSIFQGGFRPYTSYSGGTHGKDAIDNAPVTSAVVAAMRKSGIVAWDRTGKGNWAPHIHGIPVPGGGVQLSPSARAQYNSYLRGGDGLGGTDTGPKVTGGGGAVGGFELPGWISKIFGGPLKWLKGIFSDKLAGLRAKFGNSPIVNAVMGIPRKISTAVKNYFVDKFSGADAATSGLTKIGKTANAAKSYAQSQMGKFGWGGDQFSALLELWERESNWNYLAKNPSSGAYGIPQSLPGSKMAAFGKDWRTNPATQINWGLDYIDDRYGSPGSALSFHDRNNWYDDGGYLPPLNGTGKPEPVLTDAQWNAIVTNAKRGMDMPEIHVYVGDDEITEIVRVEMREQNRTLKRFVGAMGEAL